jgi:hypothetical protein
MAGQLLDGGFQTSPLDPTAESDSSVWLEALDFLESSANATFHYVERSFNTWQAALQRLAIAQLRGPYSRLQDNVMSAVGATMDLLNNMRLYLDHTETRCKAADDKSYWQTFRAACVQEYDKHFAYRFCYKLRNYAQHLAIPVDSVNFDQKGLVQLRVSSAVLLRRSAVWGSIASEISSMLSTNIDVVPLVDGAMRCLRRIELSLHEKFIDKTRRAVETVSAMREYFTSRHQLALIVTGPPGREELAVGDPILVTPVDFTILHLFVDLE